jgi:Flp pilus assembly secretin CpaC
MWNPGTRIRVLLIVLVLTVYVGSLVYNYSERERRSLRLEEEVQDSDQVHLSVRIVEANPTASEITARLSFRLAGRIARDAVTPSADLRVLLNSARGPQDFDFPKGRRINPILAVFSLDGMSTGIPSTGTALIYGSL